MRSDNWCPTASRGEVRPALAGRARTGEGLLTIDAPEGELFVRASPRFLQGLVDWCDGSRDLAALASESQSQWGPTNFDESVGAMLDAGVLVDGLPSPAGCSLTWVHDASYRGLFIAKAQGARVVAWGRSYDARQARDKALGEYAERLAARAAARFHGKIRWVEGTDARTGAKAWLPADCVMRSTTSGCAADIHLETAIERAAHELIERDAAMRHWLAQAPARRVLRASLPKHIQQRIHELDRAGCESFVLHTTLGLGPSIIVLIRNARLGFACAGSACGGNPSEVVEHAFIEAEFAAITRCRAVPVPRVGPRKVSLPGDHANLYARRPWFRRADVLIGDASQAVALESIAWPASVKARLGEEHPWYWLELAGPDGRRVRVVRAVIPGCIPIAFGFDAVPRGMVTHPVSARGRFPHPFA